MGSNVEVWKLVEPVIPCGSARKYSSRKLEKGVDVHKLQEEITSLGARVDFIDEQTGIIKAALPELDNKIRYSSLGMRMSSFPLDELQNLKAIDFKLLQFWEDLSRKQLEKLECLSNCLQILEAQKDGNKNTLPDGIDNYKEIEQHTDKKVQSDIKKNQELEVKLYFDRISCVLKSSKPTPTFYSPPRRGPQQIGREQTSKEDVSDPSTFRLQRVSIPSTLDLHQISAPSTPAHQCSPAPSTPAQQRIPTPSLDLHRISAPSHPPHQQSASGQRCKQSASGQRCKQSASGQRCKQSATIPLTPILRSPSVCTIKV